MSILYFIADLDRDADLQAAFLREPYEAMKRAGLSLEEAQVFGSGDVNRIAAVVAAEVRQFAFRPHSRHPEPLWPGPRLHLTSITPNDGEEGRDVATIVHGTYFPADFACRLELTVGGQNHVVHGQVSNVVGGIKSTANVAFALPKKLPAGQYDLHASGHTNQAESDVLRAAFTVKRAL